MNIFIIFRKSFHKIRTIESESIHFYHESVSVQHERERTHFPRSLSLSLWPQMNFSQPQLYVRYDSFGCIYISHYSPTTFAYCNQMVTLNKKLAIYYQTNRQASKHIVKYTNRIYEHIQTQIQIHLFANIYIHKVINEFISLSLLKMAASPSTHYPPFPFAPNLTTYYDSYRQSTANVV